MPWREVSVMDQRREFVRLEARITDSKGRLLAHATTTCLIFEIPQNA